MQQNKKIEFRESAPHTHKKLRTKRNKLFTDILFRYFQRFYIFNHKKLFVTFSSRRQRKFMKSSLF